MPALSLGLRVKWLQPMVVWLGCCLLIALTPGHAVSLSAGDSGGSFSTSLSGNAKYQIPLPVPPGLNAQQPRLALQYSSGTGDSLLGVGWRLSGLSSISRCSATPAVDGTRGTIAYDSGDRYCVDGQRLIVVQGDYGTAGSIYRTELETWRLFTASDEMCGSGPCSFDVSLRDGSVARYGASDDSRIVARDADGQPRADVRVWAMTDVRDTTGNVIRYAYSLSPDGTDATATDGQYYPLAIHYGGHSASGNNDQLDVPHTRHINIAWETRPDITIAWVGGGAVTTRARLQSLTTTVDTPGQHTAEQSPLTAHYYRVDYVSSTSTDRSLVSQIQTCAANPDGATDDVVCLPPDRFDWQGDRDVSFDSEDVAPGQGLSTAYREINPGDVNADGLGDLLYIRQQTTSQWEITPLLSDGQRFSQCADKLNVTVQDDDRFLVGDASGDGALDVIHIYPDQGFAVIELYPGTPGACRFGPPVQTATRLAGQPAYAWASDANGDGKVDVVFGQSSSTQVILQPYYSSGETFSAGAERPISAPANQSLFPMDVNGDGMIDIVQTFPAGGSRLTLQSWIADGQGFRSGASSEFPYPAALAGLWPMDVNGDGMSDLTMGWVTGGSILHLQTLFSDGLGMFYSGADSDTGTGANNALAFWPMDVNGDSRIDLVQAFASSRGVSLALYQNRGDAFAKGEIVASDLNGAAANTIWPLDFNGSGKMDLVQVSGTSGDLKFNGFINQGVRPDFIATFRNSLGGLNRVSYKPLSDNTVYSVQADSTDSGAMKETAMEGADVVPVKSYQYRAAPSLSPYQRVGGSVRLVVAEVVEENDSAMNPATYRDRTTYFYRNGLVSLEGRGWLGFRQVEITDVDDGLLRTNRLNQAFPLTGTVATTQYACLSALSDDPQCQQEQTLLSGSSTTYDARVLASGSGPNQAAVYEVVKKQEIMSLYTYGTLDFNRGMQYEYDDWGNPLQTADLGYVDGQGKNLSTQDDVYTCNAYQNDESATHWALGYQLHKKVSASSDCFDFTQFNPAQDFHLEHWQYDSHYNNTQYGIYDDSNNVTLNTQYQPDDYGNIIKTTLPGNRTTRIEFDTDYHSFPSRRILPPNEQGVELTEYFAYDPRYATRAAYQTASVADDSAQQGQIFLSCFDALGRTRAQQGPLPQQPAAVVKSANCVSATLTGVQAASFQQAEVVTVRQISHVAANNGQAPYVLDQQLQQWPQDANAVFRGKRDYYDGKRRQYMLLNQAGSVTPTPGGWLATCTHLDSRNKEIATLLPHYTAAVPACTPESLPAGPAETTRYDAYGRPIRRETPMSAAQTAVTIIDYSDQLNQCTTRGADSNDTYQRCTTYDYFTSQRQIVKLVVPEDDNATTTFGYDRTGRLTTVTSPTDKTTGNVVVNTMTYDSVGRRQTQDNPDQNSSSNPTAKALSLNYSTITGLLATATDALGQVTTYRQDAQGRVVRKTFADNSYVRFVYDEDGAVTPNGLGELTTEIGMNAGGDRQYQQRFGYDVYGRRAATTLNYFSESQSYQLSSVFDPQGRLLQRNFPNGAAYTQRYDMGNMVQVNGSGVLATYADYSPFGNPGRWDYSKVHGSRSYDWTGYLNGRTVYDGMETKVLDLTLEWSPLLLLNNIVDNLNPQTGMSQAYTYTAKRLTQASAPGLYGTRTYGYDTLGNLDEIDGGAISYQWHRAQAGVIGGTTLFSAQYNAIGAIEKRVYNEDTWKFDYDSRNRLNQVYKNDALQLEVPIYNDGGRRLLRRTADGQEVRYVASDYEVTLLPGDGQLQTHYVGGALGTVAAVTASVDNAAGGEGLPATGILYFAGDHLNSTSMTFDENGLLSSTRAYLPYGAVFEAGSRGPDNFRPLYQAKEYDAGSELYYFNARYYDPLIGRFLSADTGIGSHLYEQDTLNRYEFGINAPTTFTDPTGNSIWDSIAGAAIGVLEITAGMAIDVLSDGALESVGGALIGAGFNGVTYSATHSGNFSWKQYGEQEAEGAVIGLVTAGVGELFAPAEEIGADVIADGIESATAGAAEDATADALESAAGGELDAAADASADVAGDAAEDASSEIADAGADSFSGDSEVCPVSFSGDTLVLLAEGDVPIANLDVDMDILSRNGLDFSNATFPVTRTLSRHGATLLRLSLSAGNGVQDTLLLTPGHPVAVMEQGWVTAAELAVGDRLDSYDAGTVTVTEITPVSGTHTVFNLSVPPYRSYFVGSLGIWVHNPCVAIDHEGEGLSTPGGEKYDIELQIPENEYPDSARHIAEAQDSGQPEVLTINRSGARANRKLSLRGIKTKSGFDRDEYPPAMFREGGANADVELIPRWDNRASGSSFGGQLRKFDNGLRVWFHVVDSI